MQLSFLNSLSQDSQFSAIESLEQQTSNIDAESDRFSTILQSYDEELSSSTLDSLNINDEKIDEDFDAIVTLEFDDYNFKEDIATSREIFLPMKCLNTPSEDCQDAQAILNQEDLSLEYTINSSIDSDKTNEILDQSANLIDEKSNLFLEDYQMIFELQENDNKVTFSLQRLDTLKGFEDDTSVEMDSIYALEGTSISKFSEESYPRQSYTFDDISSLDKIKPIKIQTESDIEKQAKNHDGLLENEMLESDSENGLFIKTDRESLTPESELTRKTRVVETSDLTKNTKDKSFHLREVEQKYLSVQKGDAQTLEDDFVKFNVELNGGAIDGTTDSFEDYISLSRSKSIKDIGGNSELDENKQINLRNESLLQSSENQKVVDNEAESEEIYQKNEIDFSKLATGSLTQNQSSNLVQDIKSIQAQQNIRQEALPEKLVVGQEQFQDSISDMVKFTLSQNRKKAEIVLNPRELGEVSIDVEAQENGHYKVTIVTQSSGAAELFLKHQHLLEQSFIEQGADSAQLDFDFKQKDEQGSSSSKSDASIKQTTNHNEHETDVNSIASAHDGLLSIKV